ncbi:ROK family protein [Vibrio tapetis]|uniref:ROK family protein n=1 Tax=Vibrio tapetis TaxID=52443 RepID=UPI0011AB387E|nr:ROK family protein [Vibrio tapetis]
MSIESDWIRMVLVTTGGETLLESKYKTPHSVDTIVSSLNVRISNHQFRYGAIERIGISISEYLQFGFGQGTPLREKIQSKLLSHVRKYDWNQTPITCAQAAALSEMKRNKANKNERLMTVVLDTDCSIGFSTARPHAVATSDVDFSHWAHSPLPYYEALNDGLTPICRCGKENCIDQFLSISGLERQYHQLVLKNLTVQEIFDALERYDMQATRIYRMYVDQLARALSSQISQLRPTRLVLYGMISRYPALAFDLKAALGRYCNNSDIPLVSCSELGHFSSAYGATLHS